MSEKGKMRRRKEKRGSPKENTGKEPGRHENKREKIGGQKKPSMNCQGRKIGEKGRVEEIIKTPLSPC